MKIGHAIIVLAALLILSTESIKAQDYTNIYQQASSAYELGRFAQTDSLLQPCVHKMKGDTQVQAYRLLALSSLNQDKPDEAETYVKRLLDVAPYYTTYGDSPRFTEIIERLKKVTNTITTASKLAETEVEAPVPVTLITEQMIQASGARTVTDLLELYVPGISRISSLDDNIAMRGVYGLGQENILVMIDGHRINSPSTNSAATDFRNSLDKIHQIEVLRGPASSLYGNVALTAVVNIITKTGSNVEGGKVSVLAGNNNTFGGSLLLGNGNFRADYLMWASVYSSEGEKRVLNGITHYIGGYNSKPTFDIGAKIRWGDLNISAYAQHSKTVPYYNLVGATDIFSYKSYHKQNGERPGHSNTNIRVNLDYSHTWNNFMLSASAFANSEHTQIYHVLGDTINSMMAMGLLQMLHLEGVAPHTRGVWQSINWDVYSFGGSLDGAYKYKFKNNMNGAFVCGMQYENYIPLDASVFLGSNFSEAYLTRNTILCDSLEHTISAFLQLKHNFSPKFIFNGGLRYDHKIRQDLRRLNTYSPRVSFIWIPNKNISVKGGYSFSFVDAPLFYRASHISFFSGGNNLLPEKSKAIQAGATFNLSPLHLKYEVNTFYNIVDNLVHFSLGSTSAGSGNTANGGGNPSFMNSGKVKIGGIDNTIQFSTSKTYANLNFTFQHPFEAKMFQSDEHEISNVPKVLLNAAISQHVFQNKHLGDLMVRANMHFQSSTKCLNNDISKMNPQQATNNVEHQSAFAVFGAGLEWDSPFGLKTSVDVHNLFDADYMTGGILMHGVPSQSRSFVGKISWVF